MLLSGAYLLCQEYGDGVLKSSSRDTSIACCVCLGCLLFIEESLADSTGETFSRDFGLNFIPLLPYLLLKLPSLSFSPPSGGCSLVLPTTRGSGVVGVLGEVGVASWNTSSGIGEGVLRSIASSMLLSE